ncbi:MAG TPA: hypothetical protein DDX89_09070, partial [Candidatus Omnitrophica bacterium]|nr:hypothetical protein [Candidatus Omnitrophota bacterium]
MTLTEAEDPLVQGIAQLKIAEHEMRAGRLGTQHLVMLRVGAQLALPGGVMIGGEKAPETLRDWVRGELGRRINSDSSARADALNGTAPSVTLGDVRISVAPDLRRAVAWETWMSSKDLSDPLRHKAEEVMVIKTPQQLQALYTVKLARASVESPAAVERTQQEMRGVNARIEDSVRNPAALTFATPAERAIIAKRLAEEAPVTEKMVGEWAAWAGKQMSPTPARSRPSPTDRGTPATMRIEDLPAPPKPLEQEALARTGMERLGVTDAGRLPKAFLQSFGEALQAKMERIHSTEQDIKTGKDRVTVFQQTLDNAGPTAQRRDVLQVQIAKLKAQRAVLEVERRLLMAGGRPAESGQVKALQKQLAASERSLFEQEKGLLRATLDARVQEIESSGRHRTQQRAMKAQAEAQFAGEMARLEGRTLTARQAGRMARATVLADFGKQQQPDAAVPGRMALAASRLPNWLMPSSAREFRAAAKQAQHSGRVATAAERVYRLQQQLVRSHDAGASINVLKPLEDGLARDRKVYRQRLAEAARLERKAPKKSEAFAMAKGYVGQLAAVDRLARQISDQRAELNKQLEQNQKMDGTPLTSHKGEIARLEQRLFDDSMKLSVTMENTYQRAYQEAVAEAVFGPRSGRRQALLDVQEFAAQFESLKERREMRQALSISGQEHESGRVEVVRADAEPIPLDRLARVNWTIDQTNKSIRGMERASGLTLTKRQAEAALNMLMGSHRAFEFETAFGKTSVIVPVVMEGARRLYGERYQRMIAVFMSGEKAQEAFDRAGAHLRRLGNDVLLITERDLHDPDILQRAARARMVFLDQSVMGFGRTERKLEKNPIAKQLYELLTDRSYLVQDEFHTAVTVKTPYLIGLDGHHVAEVFGRAGGMVDQAIHSVFQKAHDGRGAASPQELNDWLADKNNRLLVESERNVRFTEEMETVILRALLPQSKFDPASVAKADFAQLRLMVKEAFNQKELNDRPLAEYLIDAINHRAQATRMEAGTGYGIEGRLIVPIHDGHKAVRVDERTGQWKPGMFFSSEGIAVALEFKEKGFAEASRSVRDLQTSPDSLQSTWSNVLVDVMSKGGEVLGMTGTLRGVEAAARMGFDVGSQLLGDTSGKYFGARALEAVAITQAWVMGAGASAEHVIRASESSDIMAVDSSQLGERVSKPFVEASLTAGRSVLVKEVTPAGEGWMFYTPERGRSHPMAVDAPVAEFVLARRELAVRIKQGLATSGERQAYAKINELGLEGDRAVNVFINYFGSTGTDPKIGRNTMEVSFLGERTTDIEAQQGWGRQRGIYTVERGSNYPEFGREFVPLRVYKIEEGANRAMSGEALKKWLSRNGLEDRQWIMFNTARESIAQGLTNLLERAAEGAVTREERKALLKHTQRWQSGKGLLTDLTGDGDAARTGQRALEEARDNARKFLATVSRDGALSRSTKRLITTELRELKGATIELGREASRGADAIRFKLRGGMTGAANPSDAIRMINANILASDMPHVVGRSAGGPQVAVRVAETVKLAKERLPSGSSLLLELEEIVRFAAEQGARLDRAPPLLGFL